MESTSKLPLMSLRRTHTGVIARGGGGIGLMIWTHLQGCGIHNGSVTEAYAYGGDARYGRVTLFSC